MNTIEFVGEHPKTFEVRWHTHENWELIYCTSGEGAFRFQDSPDLPYREGELVVIPPLVVHANSSTEGFTNVHMNLSSPLFFFDEPFKIQDDEDHLRLSFVEARSYYDSNKAKRELIMAALGELISSYVIAYRSNSNYPETVRLISNEILAHYTDPDFALDEFIRTLPFHYDYLRKIFKKEMGMSPLEYLIGLRMKKAEQLLSIAWTEGCAVSEIARMCGYDNALYFSRVFRKYYGCSPTQFLRHRREIHSVDPGRVELDSKE